MMSGGLMMGTARGRRGERGDRGVLGCRGIAVTVSEKREDKMCLGV